MTTDSLPTLRAAARQIERDVHAAITADYPELCGWMLRYPTAPIIRTGEGEDDWRWGSWRGRPRQEEAALRRYIDSAWPVAARRVSEAYGLGEGGRWLARHGHAGAGDDRAALAGHMGAAAHELARVDLAADDAD